MKNKSVLLHDGGYRDYQPSGPFGAYRADYFHNRVVVRKNKIALGQDAGEFKYSTRAKVEGQSVLDFLHNAGTYREVSTKKIDFISLKHFDMSRTRVVDEKLGYESDRIVNYIKDLGYFVIIDVVKFTEEDDLTMANLWHTREILSKGDNWFDTRYDSLGRHAVGGDERLLIYFPEDDRLAIGTEEQRRYKQKEHLMYQVAARYGTASACRRALRRSIVPTMLKSQTAGTARLQRRRSATNARSARRPLARSPKAAAVAKEEGNASAASPGTRKARPT